MKCQLSIIIPTHNEENNIVTCINKIPEFEWKTEIIISDDGTDNTARLASELVKKRENVIVIPSNKKLGKGGGFLKGLEKATGEVVVILDADYTVDPSELKKLVIPLFNNEADFVNGSRFFYSMEEGAMSLLHRIGNRAFALLTSLVIRKYLTDVFCGSKAFKRELLKEKLNERNWPDLELIFESKKNNLRIKEVPVHYKARKAGESKLSTFKTGFVLFKDLVDKTRRYYF